jgi:hypothetical protein
VEVESRRTKVSTASVVFRAGPAQGGKRQTNRVSIEEISVEESEKRKGQEWVSKKVSSSLINKMMHPTGIEARCMARLMGVAVISIDIRGSFTRLIFSSEPDFRS